MAQLTNVSVKIVDPNSNPKQGVIVTISNPPASYIGMPSNTPAPGAIQTQTTDGGGYVLFSGLSADTYAINVSGMSSNYIVKNSFVVNPDSIPFENRTVVASSISGSNIWTQNQLVAAGTISGAFIAANVIDDFTGGVRTAANTPSFYSTNANAVILWSGTNQGKQFNNSYVHSTQSLTAFQSTTIKMKI